MPFVYVCFQNVIFCAIEEEKDTGENKKARKEEKERKEKYDVSFYSRYMNTPKENNNDDTTGFYSLSLSNTHTLPPPSLFFYI